MAWDLIVKNARVFDGSGAAGCDLDIAISAGKIAALGENLPEEAATFVDDVRGDGSYWRDGVQLPGAGDECCSRERPQCGIGTVDVAGGGWRDHVQ